MYEKLEVQAREVMKYILKNPHYQDGVDARGLLVPPCMWSMYLLVKVWDKGKNKIKEEHSNRK